MAISAKYDIVGSGELDEAEQAMQFQPGGQRAKFVEGAAAEGASQEEAFLLDEGGWVRVS